MLRACLAGRSGVNGAGGGMAGVGVCLRSYHLWQVRVHTFVWCMFPLAAEAYWTGFGFVLARSRMGPKLSRYIALRGGITALAASGSKARFLCMSRKLDITNSNRCSKIRARLSDSDVVAVEVAVLSQFQPRKRHSMYSI